MDTPQTFKTTTYRIHYIGPDQPDTADGTIHGRTWEQVVDDVLDAGGQFITIRYMEGFDHLTVREPIATE